MISKRVLTAAAAALLFVGSVALAGEVGGAAESAGPPGKGAGGQGGSLGYVGSPQACFDAFASNALTCRSTHCVSYWFWDSCDVQGLKECQYAAKLTLALCLAHASP